QVAYDALVPPVRQALHATAGVALEALHAERLSDVYDQLAFHYAQTDDDDKAVRYLTELGERGALAYADPHALTPYQSAMGRVGPLPGSTRDRVRLGVAVRMSLPLTRLGRFGEVLDLLVPLADTAATVGGSGLASSCHFRLAMTHSYLGDQEAAARQAALA